MQLAIMIEGQNGLNWPRWKRLVRAVEDLGFVGLYRSDHFTNMNPPDLDSLELWISLAWLADHTTRIEFGPLVAPFSFRSPVFVARMGAQVDDLSGGRMTLGVGAGWQEREHSHFGFDLLDVRLRMERFEEGLEVITRLLRNSEPSSFEGKFFQLRDAVLLPRSQRPGGPPILIGGSGPKRTLPLVVKYADEWNANFVTLDVFRERNARLDELLASAGRSRDSVRRSLMTGLVFGRDDAEVTRNLSARGRTAEGERGRGIVVGTASGVVEQLGKMGEAGLQRVMLQWLDLDDLDGLEGLGNSVLPQL